MNADKRYTDGPQPENHFEATAPLPQGYGDNRLVLLPRDPHWFFSYWDYTEEAIGAVRAKAGAEIWDAGAWVLRVYDLTDIEANDLSRAPFFDVEVSADARQWYVKLEHTGRTIEAEFGRRASDGRFFALFRSNRIRLPVGRVSEKIDSQWMAIGAQREQAVQWENFVEKLASSANESRGSVEIAKTMARRWEFLRSVFSGSWPTSSKPGSHTMPALSGFFSEEPKS